MDVNFRLILPNGDQVDADNINWVSWNEDGGGIKAAFDGPDEGRSLVLDMKTIPLEMLLAISENNFEGIRELKLKNPYKHLTTPITNVISVARDKVVFETEDGQFELLINANPLWVRPRSPFSYQ